MEEKVTILVIEDEEMVLNVSLAMLKRLGYNGLGAQTGRAALEYIKQSGDHVRVALLDIQLPDMEAAELYSLLMQAHPQLKVIVCSGYGAEGPAKQIMQAGAQDFMQKPFSMQVLRTKLEELFKEC